MEGLHFDLSEQLTTIPTIVAHDGTRLSLVVFAQRMKGTYDWNIVNLDGNTDPGMVETYVDQDNGINWKFAIRGNYKVTLTLNWNDPFTEQPQSKTFEFTFFVNKFYAITGLIFMSNTVDKENG